MSKKNRRRRSKAAVRAAAKNPPKPVSLVGSAAIDLTAAADGEEKRQPTFEILAYTGGLLNVWGYYLPIVLDLKGIQAARVSVLLDHLSDQIVGQGTSKIRKREIVVSGKVTGDPDDPAEPAGKVIGHSKRGFVWSASVGVHVNRTEEIAAGSKVKVNGQTFSGPIIVVRAGRLGEVSFVSVGADEGASASVAARAETLEDKAMKTFEEWLEAMGLVLDDLDDDQKVKLQAKYDAEVKAAAGDGEPAAKPDATDPPAGTVTPAPTSATPPVTGVAPGETVRELEAAETERIAAVRAVCGVYGARGMDTDALAKVEAQAIRDKWGRDQVELTLLRAERPKAPAVHSVSLASGPKVLSAALAMGVGLGEDRIIKAYGEESLAGARKQFGGPIGAGQFVLECAWANGFTGRRLHTGNLREVLTAAFSTQGAADILSNVANKVLLDAYMAVESTWRAICSIRPVNDFKTQTHYRLTGDMTYEEVGPTGEIAHAVTADENWTNQALTYAKMFVITRTDLVNDDLGAFDDLRKMLGRGAATALNQIFWAVFMDNLSFFTAARLCYFEGAATNLQSSSLSTAVQMFREQVDPDGHPLALTPKILLVPAALEATADELFVARNINTGGAATTEKVSDSNTHAAKYVPHQSAYLSNSSFTGNSDTAWYLLADPNDLATVQVVFLNGQESPTVESAEADFDTLGVQIRGYHDFGVAQAEYRAGVMSKGAA